MVKIYVYKYNRAYMAPLGVHSYNLKEPTIELFDRAFPYFGIVILNFALASTGVFFYQNMNEVKEALESFKIFVGASQSGICALVVAFQMRKIKILHMKLQALVDENENVKEVNWLYWSYEQKCRKYTLRLVLYVVFHTLEFTIVLFYAFGCMIVGDFDTSKWYLSFKLVFPFETRSVLGWFSAWFIEFDLAFAYSIYMTAITSYFVCGMLYICAMCDHFSLLMNFIERYIGSNRNYKKSRKQALGLLVQAVDLHGKVFEFSKILAIIMTGPIFGLLPLNAVFMAVSMFDMEQTFANFDILVFLFDTSCIISALLWPYLFCRFADLTTNKIASIGDAAYETKWYNFPVDLQKHIVLVIMRSHDIIYFTGLGLVCSTLQVFGDILRTSLSYYMLYRTLALH